MSLALWKTKKQKPREKLNPTNDESVRKKLNCWNVQEEEEEEGEFSIVGFEKLVRNETPGECGVPQPMASRLCK